MTIYSEGGLLTWHCTTPKAAAKERIKNCNLDLQWLNRRLEEIEDVDHKQDINDRICVVILNRDKFKRQLSMLESEEKSKKRKS